MLAISQALSGEMVLDKLIDKLMRAALEHAGAVRGPFLIAPRGDELQIQAEATAGRENVTALSAGRSPDCTCLEDHHSMTAPGRPVHCWTG